MSITYLKSLGKTKIKEIAGELGFRIYDNDFRTGTKVEFNDEINMVTIYSYNHDYSWARDYDDFEMRLDDFRIIYFDGSSELDEKNSQYEQIMCSRTDIDVEMYKKNRKQYRSQKVVEKKGLIQAQIDTLTAERDAVNEDNVFHL